MLRESSAALQLAETTQSEPIKTRQAYITPQWWGNVEPDLQLYKSKTRWIVKNFVLGTLRGKILDNSSNGRHIYSVRKGGSELWLFKDNPTTKIHLCVARKLGGAFVGNASSLAWTTMNGKLYALNGRNERIQQALADVMPMVPFAMLKENGFDIDTLRVIDRGAEETLKIAPRHGKGLNDQHFTGAMLFKIEASKKERQKRPWLKVEKNQHFLFDVDRGDLKDGIFNPFLSRLAGPCKTIEEAYESFKPQEVRDAERFLKRECVRQGEWYFIPVVGEFKKQKAGTRYVYGNSQFNKFNAVLQSKGNHPHYAMHISDEGYVTGEVAHGGYEHPSITLEGWHKAVPNTAIASFTITGGVD